MGYGKESLAGWGQAVAVPASLGVPKGRLGRLKSLPSLCARLLLPVRLLKTNWGCNRGDMHEKGFKNPPGF